MPEWDANKIGELVSGLESEDAFTRLGAIDELMALTQRSFGFRFNDPPEVRAAAVERWKDYVREDKRRRERKSQLEAAVQIGGGLIDMGALKKAIKEIPADKIQGYLNALISKMKSMQTRCEGCGVRPASVSVTEKRDGKYRTRAFCDVCAHERGDLII